MNDRSSSSFWDWSLLHYRRPDIESLTIELQDAAGFNVNMLLWLCWCAEHYESAPDLVIRKAVDALSGWNREVTGKLRDARRFLKTAPTKTEHGSVEPLRAQIKKAEIAAEKVEQSMLETLADRHLNKSPASDNETRQSRARRNLATYAALIGAGKQQGFSTSLLHALIDHIFDDASLILKKESIGQ